MPQKPFKYVLTDGEKILSRHASISASTAAQRRRENQARDEGNTHAFFYLCPADCIIMGLTKEDLLRCYNNPRALVEGSGYLKCDRCGQPRPQIPSGGLWRCRDPKCGEPRT